MGNVDISGGGGRGLWVVRGLWFGISPQKYGSKKGGHADMVREGGGSPEVVGGGGVGGDMALVGGPISRL